MKKKFYVTTAIDYPNAEPHIGHAYQKIIADVFTRWHKKKNYDVFFLTGTDEHGKKIQEAAEKSGKKPKEFVDELAEKFKEAWKSLDIEPDRFIRTTDADHEKLVQEAIKKCEKNGDIYLDKYEGLYCTGCEAYYTEKDSVYGKCPLHNRKLEVIKEESYFFKLSKYQKFLLELYKTNPEFILPKERRNEMISRVKEGLKDLSISRTSFDWGIPFPGNKKHIVYVWFDALFNYVSGAGKNEKYWPAELHLLGKDNAWFHCVYWPAFLKSAGYKLPKTVFVHGFLTFNGQKISKSLGNAISPKNLVDKYGADAVRYFVCRNFVFGEDGDFSEESLVERYNGELANKLGNLVSRVSGLIEKIEVEKTENKLVKKLDEKKINKLMENYEIDKALNEIFNFIDVCNEYVQNKKPWETKDKKVLYELKESILKISELIWPFIPSSSEKITKIFSEKKIVKAEVLFPKIEFEEKIEEQKIIIKESKINGKGLFANKDFKKGEPVILWNNEAKYLSEKELKKLPSELKKYVALYNNKYLLIASPERYLNHSCNPNVETRKDGIEYATKNINNGEELTGDYTKVKTFIGFECNCKEKNCKKIIEGENRKDNKHLEINEIMAGVGTVNFADWEKIDLRVAQIKKVEDIPDADKLYKLTIDVGELGQRTICAGIKQFYTKEKLKNKKIIVFANLAPRMMRGIESQGMLLAASSGDHKKVLLLSPDGDAEPGMRVS